MVKREITLIPQNRDRRTHPCLQKHLVTLTPKTTKVISKCADGCGKQGLRDGGKGNILIKRSFAKLEKCLVSL